jgi:hypothetical protein
MATWRSDRWCTGTGSFVLANEMKWPSITVLNGSNCNSVIWWSGVACRISAWYHVAHYTPDIMRLIVLYRDGRSGSMREDYTFRRGRAIKSVPRSAAAWFWRSGGLKFSDINAIKLMLEKVAIVCVTMQWYCSMKLNQSWNGVKYDAVRGSNNVCVASLAV